MITSPEYETKIKLLLKVWIPSTEIIYKIIEDPLYRFIDGIWDAGQHNGDYYSDYLSKKVIQLFWEHILLYGTDKYLLMANILQQIIIKKRK